MFRRLLHTLTFGLLGKSNQSPETEEEIDLNADPELRSAIQEVARLQASGLDGATVTIHSVTEHAAFHGVTPQPGHKLIVVDVTFKDHKTGFGLAGIQLIDGEKEEAESYGGDPHQIYLEEDGSLMKDQSGGHLVGPMDWVNDKPIRVFMVYSAPKAVKKVGLGYWDRIIVDRPYEVIVSR